MHETKEKLERQIQRTKNKIQVLKEKHGDKPNLNFTYRAGWELGYWEGRLSVLEDVLDKEEVK